MVEFTVTNAKVRINPALVAALYQREGAATTSIFLSDGSPYEVPGTIDEVDNKLTASYTDIRYLAFVIEALCNERAAKPAPPNQPDQES